LKPKESTFVSYLNCVKKSIKPQDAYKILKKIEQPNIPPSNELLIALLEICAMQRDILTARKVFEEAEMIMKNTTNMKSIAILTQMIRCLGRSGHFKEAEEMYQRMLHDKVWLTAMTYQHLIEAAYEAKSLEKVQFYISEMRRNQIVPNKHTFSMILKAFRIHDDPKAVGNIWKEIQQLKLEDDQVLFSSLLKTYDSMNEHQMMLSNFEKRIDSGKKMYMSDFNVAIQAAFKTGLVEKQKEYFDIALEKKIINYTIKWSERKVTMTMDLHFYTIGLSTFAVKWGIDKLVGEMALKENTDGELLIITGKGNTVRDEPKSKKAIVQMLDSEGIEFKIPTNNKGRILVEVCSKQ